MHFGSVQFFKVLIKAVLAVLFFVPLILAVVFGVLFAQKNAKVDELTKQNTSIQQENDKLSVIADVLVSEKAATAESVRNIMNRSGVSYEDVIKLAAEKKDLSAQGLYDILSKAGISDKDIISMAAAKKTVSAEEFYSIMNKNGISAKDLVKVVVRNSGMTDEDFYALLSECGISDERIIEIINRGGQSGETSTPIEEDSPYADLYPDMYVTAPTNYTYEEGTIYFTFDDGPSQYTYSYLEYLKKYKVKATWFVVPSKEQWNMDCLKAISNAGHTIGVHSLTHDYNKIYASVEAYLEDFYGAWSIIKEATGQTPELFRFAGGSNNDYNADTRDAIIKEMTRRGFRFFDWNVDSGDADGATWQDMYNSIPRECGVLKRPIILMHDAAGKQSTLYVFENVLQVLMEEGYKFDCLHNDTRPIQFVGPFGY